MEITAGTQINGLTFVRELGRGGMGIVYLAHDRQLGRECAVKVLHSHLIGDETARARFYTEVRAASAIDHPAIVKTYSVDELPGGTLCCRMEYVDGMTLTDFCRRRGVPGPSQILRIIGPLCEAFDKLHALHIIHRDLKPDNVLIVDRGGHVYPRVLDFGIALRADEPRLTRPGLTTGTMAYMSPEQLAGKAEIDHRSDVYSLGVLMYWMSTGGHLPYEVAEGALYFAQQSEPPIDPRRRNSGVSELAASVILTALQPEPSRRPRSMGAVALMYARCVPRDGIQPDGSAILRECAPGLLKVSNLDETLRDSSVAKSRGTNTTWKYDYGPTLGRGGMAEVVRATQRGAGQFAVARALKLILPEFAQAPQFEEMFHAEARIAALLQHRNIVRVLDHDRDPMGRLYLAMEFVDGVDLQKLRQSGPLPHDVIIFVLCEVLEALDYIHHLPPTNPLASPEEIAARGGARGLVHRDVSHDNVLISWEHEVKLSDFGIAKLQMGTWAQGSVQIKGKPRYMSPELASGAEKLDGRSDLWAVGVMLWELLTGHTLFDCESHMATLHAVMWAAITPPSAMVPGVQPQLEAVVMRLLEREITRRFQTAHEVIAALQSCHGASRDGRAALAQLLAQRFPDRARPIAASSPAIQSSDARLSQPPALSQPAHAGAAGDRPRSPSAGGPSAFAVPLAEGAAPLWQAASTTGHALGQAVPMPARLTRRWPWFAMLGAVVAAGGWTLVHQAARARATDAAPVILPAATAESPARPPAPAAPAPPVPASPVSPAAPVAASPAPAQITATISSKPPGATIRVEGLSPPIVGRSPVTVVAAPGTQLRVVAELPGFQSAVQTSMINGEHHDILVTLEPASAEKTISRPAPSAVPKPKAARPAKLPDDPGIIE